MQSVDSESDSASHLNPLMVKRTRRRWVGKDVMTKSGLQCQNYMMLTLPIPYYETTTVD